MPHAIVVDENKQLRDGYISYLLAKKYAVRVDVYKLVNTKKGRAYICVDRIEYTAGKGFCSRYNTVKKHMNMRMEEGDDTNDGK